MSEPFIAEIRIFAGNFAPRGWAFCNGALVQVSQNTALFSLVGTIYGGDGRTTFGLPDLQGRAPMHTGEGAGPGLTDRTLGEGGGAETVTLTAAQMPNHSHTLQGLPAGLSGVANSSEPDGGAFAVTTGTSYGGAANQVDLSAAAIPNTGGSQPHGNMHPFLTVNFIIALQGVYPSQA